MRRGTVHVMCMASRDGFQFVTRSRGYCWRGITHFSPTCISCESDNFKCIPMCVHSLLCTLTSFYVMCRVEDIEQEMVHYAALPELGGHSQGGYYATLPEQEVQRTAHEDLHQL